MNQNQTCQCGDPMCPVPHGRETCEGRCTDTADITLYRVDMLDETGTRFCAACAEDAMDSGLFTARLDED